MSTKKATEAKAMINDFQELVRRIKEMETFDSEVARDEVANQFDLLMKKEGVSKAELARRLGKSRAYVTKILQGNANFTLDTLVKIAGVLGYKLALMFVPKEMEWQPAKPMHLSAKVARTTSKEPQGNEDYVPGPLSAEEGDDAGNKNRLVG